MATTTPQKLKHPQIWRLTTTVALLAVGIYSIAGHWHTISSSFTVLKDSQPGWIAATLLAIIITFCLAAYTYSLLALKPLKYLQTLNVEVAAALANRVLPAGIGGLGLHDLYLHKRKHSVAQATAIVSVNNLLGIAAHLTLLGIVVVVKPAVLQSFSRHYGLHMSIWLVGLVIVGLALLGLFLGRRVMNFLSNMLRSLGLLRLRRLGVAFLLSMLLTVVYTFTLLASSRSIGLLITPLQAFVVFSIGMLVGTATPTPGGLVGTEAALFGGFIGYGATAGQAAAAVIVYRLITYWLPILPGAAALLLARRRQLI